VKIYVGNLSYDVKEDDLRQAFESFGDVYSVNIIKDRYTGRPKGFGFVEMPVEDEAKAAIKGINGTTLNGREIRVNEARPRSEKRSWK
jgi:RNA recognition motif-containing protein